MVSSYIYSLKAYFQPKPARSLNFITHAWLPTLGPWYKIHILDLSGHMHALQAWKTSQNQGKVLFIPNISLPLYILGKVNKTNLLFWLFSNMYQDIIITTFELGTETVKYKICLMVYTYNALDGHHHTWLFSA